jgi:hypothetical protein
LFSIEMLSALEKGKVIVTVIEIVPPVMQVTEV